MMLENNVEVRKHSSAAPGSALRSEPDARLFSSLRFCNLLSFGPDSPALPMENLNVIIGPNGSGKSNFIELIRLLSALPKDIETPFRGGQAGHWMWKGNPRTPTPDSNPAKGTRSSSHGYIDAVINRPYRTRAPGEEQLQYQLEMVVNEISGPKIIRESLTSKTIGDEVVTERQYVERTGRNQYRVRDFSEHEPSADRRIDRAELESEQSILYQMNSSSDYAELARLSRVLGDVRCCREWSFGHTSLLRKPQVADKRNDRVHEDLSNIYLILSRIGRNPMLKETLLKHLRQYAADITGFEVVVQSGFVELYLHEGESSFPASRLSDGALRYICLLTILCDPDPPPLICIEGPELGLHMDVLPPLVKLMQHAATKTQLVITTHSDILLDYLSDTPESVVVCKKIDGATQLRRITHAEYQRYIDIVTAGDDVPDSDVGLGLLWHDGFLGGVK